MLPWRHYKLLMHVASGEIVVCVCVCSLVMHCPHPTHVSPHTMIRALIVAKHIMPTLPNDGLSLVLVYFALSLVNILMNVPSSCVTLGKCKFTFDQTN